jgi:hypothetical protein
MRSCYAAYIAAVHTTFVHCFRALLLLEPKQTANTCATAYITLTLLRTHQQIVRVTLDAVYCLAHFLAPAIPAAAHSIFTKCGTPPQPIQALQTNFKNLQPGTFTTVGRILFNKLEPPSSTVGATAAVPPYASPVTSVGGKQPGGAPAAPPLDGRVSPTIAHDDASKDSSSSSSKVCKCVTLI